jgi:hypothetical protein
VVLPVASVNSRTVEDRNQQSVSAFMVDAAMVQQILSSFMSSHGEAGVPLGPLGRNITFGTSDEGRRQTKN